MRTKRKKITFKEYDKAIAGVGDANSKLEIVEATLQNEREEFREEQNFLNARIAILQQKLDHRETEIENLQEVISSLGRTIIAKDVKVHDLKQEKYIQNQSAAYESVNNYIRRK